VHGRDDRNKHSRVGAIILAAGRSTRMGEAKQLLRMGESTVLDQTLAHVRGAGVDEIVLVLGFSAQTIRERLPISVIEGLKVVVNQAYEQGMASSLREGLSALDPRTDAALIVLADQPFIRSDTLNRIVEEHRRTRAQIVIPLYRGFRGNPVLLDRSVFPKVMALDGDIGCRAIFGSHLEGIVKVEVDDVGILLDIDNKDDYERLRGFGQSGLDERALLKAANHEERVIPGLVESGIEDSQRADELIIVGSEQVAIALAKLGQLLNFIVTVVDPLLEISVLPPGVRLLKTLDLSFLPENRRRYVVVASRGKFDEEAVEQALHSHSVYVGLVASKKRGQEILCSLERKGESPEKLATVRVPAGLNIGADTPEEIALSIAAEIISRRSECCRSTEPGNR
jgi:molybdenum cofactor cytidylyltransferase